MRKTLGSLIVSLGMDARQVDQGLKKLERDLKNTGRNMENMGKKMSLAFTAPLTALAYKSVEAFNRQAQAERKLELAAGSASKALKEQASAIQRLTTFGDEAIIEQQAFLASLGLSEKQVMSTTQAAVNLSAALGISLESATKNLAKTTAGLTGELGELLPGLKQFSAEQLKSGAAIEYANKQFAGFAEEAAKTGTGPLTQLNNQLGDLAEQVGKIILPFITKLAEKVRELADWFDGLSESQKEHLVQVAGLVAMAGPVLILAGNVVKLAGSFSTLTLAMQKLALTKGGIIGIALAVGQLAGEMNKVLATKLQQDAANGGSEFLYRANMAGLVFSNTMLGQFGKAGDAWNAMTGAMPTNPSTAGSAAGSPFWPSTSSPYVMAPAGGGGGLLGTAPKLPGGPAKPKAQGIALDMYYDAFSPVGSQYAGVDWSVKSLPMLQGGVQGGGGGLDPSGMANILPDMTQDLQVNMDFWREWSGTVVNAIGMMGQSLAEGENFFKAFGKTALAVANQVIQASIGKIIAQIVAGESGKGLVGALLGLAGAGVVVGMLGSLINKSSAGAPKLAEGGLAYGPTMAMVGDNPAANVDPEVISPLSKLKQMLNPMGGGSIQVQGVVRGDDILLTTAKAQQYANRRGSGNVIRF